MKKYSRNEGFTLIELAIASFLLALAVGGMTLALQQQQRQFRFTNETVDIDQTARTVLDFIATEVRNAGARQGKNLSIQHFNGGSVEAAGNRCIEDIEPEITGTKDSPPDCITITTWDISRGLENNPADPEDNETNIRPSKVEQPKPPLLQGGVVVIDLPEPWFDDSGEFIGGTINEDGDALLGFRSSATLCHPDQDINCLQNPERCTQCAMVFQARIDESAKQATIDSIDDIVSENLPVTFNSVSELINGLDPDPTDNDPTVYGLIQSITLQAAEVSIVKTKTFRLNPVNRELQLSEDGGDFETIAGGQVNTPGALESPGIVDLQFVFHLQDPDGNTSRVGMCIDDTCNDANERVFDDFRENIVLVDDYYGTGASDGTEDLRCCLNREQDIRAVEIFLVVKSKSRPKGLSGNLVRQNIRQIADVGERISPKTVGQTVDDSGQSEFNEPEEGFVYRIFTTTVYMRNLSTENYG